jgi:hypothetical protein
MVHFNDGLYVFGGSADSTLPNQLFRLVITAPQYFECHGFRYDLTAHRWDQESCLESTPPAGRCFHTACVIDSSMYIYGGTTEFSQSVRSNEIFKFAWLITLVFCCLIFSQRYQFSDLPSCTLIQDLTALLDYGAFDVTFLIGSSQSRVCAHAAILAARSNIFAELLENLSRPCEVAFEDTGLSAFQAVIHFIYSDVLPQKFLADSLDPAVLHVWTFSITPSLFLSRNYWRCTLSQPGTRSGS